MNRFLVLGSQLPKAIDHLESKGFRQTLPCYEEQSAELKLFIDNQKLEFFLCDDNALEYSSQVVRLEHNEEPKEASIEEILKL